ncbi:hypothetical protein TWF730_010248 [Orbilia blumenaviensis]|uniref:Peptidase C14 caspase domain-containing protein n=1 Tax=Orbilia blumenaviensis TaxID=1796055 RepID=A0AAV9UNP3_9PEZI
MGASIWAILVGIDYYQPGDQRPDIEFPDLKGCVEDINQIEAMLRDLPGPKLLDIRRLTASAPDNGGDEPKEPPDERPTYANIVEAFERVIRDAHEDDIIYIHYSGHGAQVKTIFSDLKDNGLDEVLVPMDISCGGRYLRDVELAGLLEKMVAKKLVVTLILDSCHSGVQTAAATMVIEI